MTPPETFDDIGTPEWQAGILRGRGNVRHEVRAESEAPPHLIVPPAPLITPAGAVLLVFIIGIGALLAHGLGVWL